MWKTQRVDSLLVPSGYQLLKQYGTEWKNSVGPHLACVLGRKLGPLPFPSGEHTSGYDRRPVFKPSTQGRALKTLVALRLAQEAPRDLAGAGLPDCPLCRQMLGLC